MKALKWGIYLIVFCLPLYLLRFEIFNIPTTVLEIMIYALFLLWLAKSGFKGLKAIIKENRFLFIAVFLILLGVSLATLRSWDLRLSAGIWKSWFVDPLLFFIVFISAIKSKKEIRNVFYALIFSGFVVSLISLVYLFLGKLDPEGRLQGIYNSPNYLAMYLAPALIISFFCLLQNYSHENTRRSPSETSRCASPSLCPAKAGQPCPLGLWSIFLVSNFSLSTLILYCTRSFGAWIGVLAATGIGLMIWLWSSGNKKTAIILAVFLLLACVSIYFVKFNTRAGMLSINSRVEIWQQSVWGLRAYPLLGIGPGTFKDFFPLHPDWQIPQPHNLYLAFLLQTGIIGFLGFILLLLWFFWHKANQPWDNIQLLLISIMVYILVHGLVDTLYWKNDLSIVFWLVIGATLVLKSKCQNPNYFK